MTAKSWRLAISRDVSFVAMQIRVVPRAKKPESHAPKRQKSAGAENVSRAPDRERPDRARGRIARDRIARERRGVSSAEEAPRWAARVRGRARRDAGALLMPPAPRALGAGPGAGRGRVRRAPGPSSREYPDVRPTPCAGCGRQTRRPRARGYAARHQRRLDPGRPGGRALVLAAARGRERRPHRAHSRTLRERRDDSEPWTPRRRTSGGTRKAFGSRDIAGPRRSAPAASRGRRRRRRPPPPPPWRRGPRVGIDRFLRAAPAGTARAWVILEGRTNRRGEREPPARRDEPRRAARAGGASPLTKARGRVIVPCGAVRNDMFFGTFRQTWFARESLFPAVFEARKSAATVAARLDARRRRRRRGALGGRGRQPRTHGVVAASH